MAMQQEIYLLNTVFGVAPAFGCFNDGTSPNALATNAPLAGQRDGTVLFGRRLLMEEVPKGEWAAAVLGIMAHEWAHIRQFKVQDARATKFRELHADCCAGWYLGWKRANGRTFVGHSFLQSLFEKGDFAFNSPTHHGTPEERVEAMQVGFGIAMTETVGLVNPVFAGRAFNSMFSRTKVRYS